MSGQTILIRALLAAALLVAGWSSPVWADPPPSPAALRTVAESSNYQRTSRHADVMEFCRQLAQRSPRVALDELGTSVEGRALPLLILGDPPPATPREALRSKKLVVLALGNIHAGEVCGKEALLMLARDLVAAERQPLFDDLVLLLAPIYNADGNERFSRLHRPQQNGPGQVGQRGNAQGLDLNRDYIKLQSPEVRAVVRLLNDWQPAVTIDCHTTNGSYHRYALTYDSPRHPATDAGLLAFARDELLPEVGRRLERTRGYRTFYFGNFSADYQAWQTYPALPRYGTHYLGLRNQIGILSEAYAYAPFRDRVLATQGFVQQCLETVVDRKAQLEPLLATARAGGGADSPDAPQQIGIRFTPAPLPGRFTVAGFQMRDQDGKQVPTDQPQDYSLQYLGQSRATLSVARPYAYLVPAGQRAAVEKLHQHGVSLQVLREDIELDAEFYQVTALHRAEREFQNHHPLRLEVAVENKPRRFEAGSIVVPTDQPLSRLIVNLLEPASQDGLATWNFFDEALEVGGEFPVARLARAEPLLTADYQPPPETPDAKKPITFETLFGGDAPNFSGRPASSVRWLDDEHYLQRKQGRLYKVHAATGRNELADDPDAVAAALERELQVDERTARRLAASLRLDPQSTAGVVDHAHDLYWVAASGQAVVRLTNSPAREELATFSPDGRRVAFVREGELCVVDVEGRGELQLTHDANDTRTNGKADWVYFEEIYGRSWHAFKWSPDASRLVFQQFDDAPVGRFAVPHDLPRPQQVEMTRYPLAGTPNPHVRLGVVRADGGAVQWIDPGEYSPDNMLISHFTWTPDSQAVFFYVQDRAQRWLDVNRYELADGARRTLLRDRTEAWVSNPGDPWFLDDGSFLLTSERDGWQHLYRFDGEQLQQVTRGPWEMRRLHVVDQEQGWLYFSATVASHLAENLYRVRLDGSDLTRLTDRPGHHGVAVSPGGRWFVDVCSDPHTPARVQLYSGDGRPARNIDTNPVPEVDQYVFAPLEMLQIEARDGFPLEASLIKPPDFDPAQKYPVWLMTYGGPHAPTMSQSWRRGRAYEQMLAQMGIIAFRVDPRSASGKGARAAWTAYRRLGLQEVADLEDAVDWLCRQPYVDRERIGMAGHSYGGYLTALAMTHTKKFAAGISGAPVTDWRNYDTIYTERYMDTPQENPDGYKSTSVIEAAGNLHGRLLILHGSRDDNVHLANTLQLVQALQRANKQFELMVYPDRRHPLFGAHYNRLTVDFIRRTMLGDAAAGR